MWYRDYSNEIYVSDGNLIFLILVLVCQGVTVFTLPLYFSLFNSLENNGTAGKERLFRWVIYWASALPTIANLTLEDLASRSRETDRGKRNEPFRLNTRTSLRWFIIAALRRASLRYGPSPTPFHSSPRSPFSFTHGRKRFFWPKLELLWPWTLLASSFFPSFRRRGWNRQHAKTHHIWPTL